MQNKKITQGFTLVELLVVIGILGVLLAITLVAINPSRQFKMANDTKRQADINNIVNAIAQVRVDNKGVLPTTIGGVAITDATLITYAKGTAAFASADFKVTAPATRNTAGFAIATTNFPEYICSVLTGWNIATGTGTPNVYLATIPLDPVDGYVNGTAVSGTYTNTVATAATTAQAAHCSNGFTSGYKIAQDSNGRITLSAMSELGSANVPTRATFDLTASR